MKTHPLLSKAPNTEFIEKICENSKTLSSPFPAESGEIFFASEDGGLFKFKEGLMSQLLQVDGQPNGLVLDAGGNLFVADMAHQSIFTKPADDKSDELRFLVKDWEGEGFLGLNSLEISADGTQLYFSDSGPLGASSLDSPRGSVFALDVERMVLSPLANRCLAYPSGLALCPKGQVLYVCETLRNRVLKIYLGPQNGELLTVFHQFSGRLGPTALSTAKDDLIAIARFEFARFLIRCFCCWSYFRYELCGSAPRERGPSRSPGNQRASVSEGKQQGRHRHRELLESRRLSRASEPQGGKTRRERR
mgnify:CR=1 FL=1